MTAKTHKNVPKQIFKISDDKNVTQNAPKNEKNTPKNIIKNKFFVRKRPFFAWIAIDMIAITKKLNKFRP